MNARRDRAEVERLIRRTGNRWYPRMTRGPVGDRLYHVVLRYPGGAEARLWTAHSWRSLAAALRQEWGVS